MKKLKKIMKITGVILLVFFFAFVAYFYYMSSIKSDEHILKKLNLGGSEYEMVHTGYEGVQYRYAVDRRSFNTQKPTILFVHGAIGSSSDFEAYVTNPEFSSLANMIVFDRPNYGPDYNENYIHEIDFEAALVSDLLNQYKSGVKNIFVGYSYGGPIALKAHYDEPVDAVVLLAPAVDPENEFVPFLVNVYRFNATRWLVPTVWKEASKEKLDHVNQLNKQLSIYSDLQGNIVHLHGTDDMLVPYENVAFLQDRISSDVYTHVPVEGAGHGFVWSSDEIITDALLRQLR